MQSRDVFFDSSAPAHQNHLYRASQCPTEAEISLFRIPPASGYTVLRFPPPEYHNLDEAKETKNTIVTEWERSGDKDEMIQYSRKHSRQCILIVDDSEINRAILYEMLHQDYDIIHTSLNN